MDWDQFSKSLVDHGFFRYLRPRQSIPRMLARIKAKNFIFTAQVYRDYPADEESIGEWRGTLFLPDLKHILRANNVQLKSVIESPTPGKLLINGTEYILCSGEEFNQSVYTIQHIITRRLFAVINTLLKDAGSEERLFSLYGGNDHWGIFLTRDLYNLILKSDFAEDVKDLVLYED